MRKLIDERRYVKAEVPRYDASTAWEKCNERVSTLNVKNMVEEEEKNVIESMFKRTNVLGNPTHGEGMTQTVFIVEDDQ